jgi:hypothetical protein
MVAFLHHLRSLMAPMVTLYILGGCVAASIGLLIVMMVVSAMRTPVAATPRMVTRPSYPSYPASHKLRLYRFFVVIMVAAVLLSTASIAYPPLLDPLCEYQWFGSDATLVVREHARGAHASIAGLVAR